MSFTGPTLLTSWHFFHLKNYSHFDWNKVHTSITFFVFTAVVTVLAWALLLGGCFHCGFGYRRGGCLLCGCLIFARALLRTWLFLGGCLLHLRHGRLLRGGFVFARALLRARVFLRGFCLSIYDGRGCWPVSGNTWFNMVNVFVQPCAVDNWFRLIYQISACIIIWHIQLVRTMEEVTADNWCFHFLNKCRPRLLQIDNG